MKQRIIEVSSEFFTQLSQHLEQDEQHMSNEHADSHGANYVLWTQDHKRLVFVRKRASTAATSLT